VPFLIAAVAALLLTPAAAWAGTALGVVDRPDGGELKIHARPIPLTGGIAVAVAALGAAAVAGDPVPAAAVGCVAIALVTGLVDDVRPLPAWVRVGLLSAAGVVAATGGIRLPSPGWVGGILTVALVLACANGVNLVDGQDGLAGGLAAIAALGLAAVASVEGASDVVTGALALAGACVGFLAWNRPPARVFLGNAGAYAVGSILALEVVTIVGIAGWIALIACACCLGVFAFELLTTVLRRASSRGSLAVGDRLHSYDLLSQVVASRPIATVAFWGFGVLAALLSLGAARLPVWGAVAIALAALAAAGIAWGLVWREVAKT